MVSVPSSLPGSGGVAGGAGAAGVVVSTPAAVAAMAAAAAATQVAQGPGDLSGHQVRSNYWNICQNEITLECESIGNMYTLMIKHVSGFPFDHLA